MKIKKKKKQILSISQQPKDLSQLGSLLSCFILFYFLVALIFWWKKFKGGRGKSLFCSRSGTEAAGHVDHIHTWEAERWESSCAAQVPQRDWCHPQWAGLLPQLSQQVKPIASQKPICHAILVSATLTENSNYHSTLHSGKSVLLDIQEKNNNPSRSPKIERQTKKIHSLPKFLGTIVRNVESN